jgi:hypothetical protein
VEVPHYAQSKGFPSDITILPFKAFTIGFSWKQQGMEISILAVSITIAAFGSAVAAIAMLVPLKRA